jgi:hypothetical protein
MKHLLALLLASAALPAVAAPVQLSYVGVVKNVNGIVGPVVGSAFTIDLILDNGGSDLISQSWNLSHFVSISVLAGPSYSAFESTSTGGSISVATDGTGALSTLNVSLIILGLDSAGQTYFDVYMNGGNNVFYYTDAGGAETGQAMGADTPPNLSNTSISMVGADVPLPGGLALMLGGLAVFGLMRRRTQA